MAWTERTGDRTAYARTYEDTADPAHRHYELRLGTALHYDSVLDSGAYDATVNMTPEHITAGGRDLWRVQAAGWHYALGLDVEGVLAGLDGTVGVGGRQGAHWLKFRLERVGYLHWSTRAWEDVGGAVTYDRGNLSSETHAIEVGPNAESVTALAEALWTGLWTTPGGGSVDARWIAQGDRLVERVAVNQEAREWIAANAPPSTPAGETWFGFAYRLDVSDVPRWVVDGVLQDPDGDFSDDGGEIVLQDALERLLGFLPASRVYGEDASVRLRKRLWYDGSDHWLLVGARVDLLNALPAGGVVFDPEYSSQPDSSGTDTYLKEGAADDNEGNDATLDHNNNSGGAVRRHSLIKFDLSGLGGSTVNSATLSFWWETAPGDTGTLYAHRILAANNEWTEAGATWNYAVDDTDRWEGDAGGNGGSDAGCSQSGTDYNAAAMGSTGWDEPLIDTEIAITLDEDQTETLIATNYGIFIRGDQDGLHYLHSSDAVAGDAAYRPKLVIDYTAGVGATTQFFHYRHH